MIHQLADVQSTQIGEGTTIWQYAVILKGAQLGSNCNINCHTFIEGEVSLGNRVTVKSGVYLWNGVTVEDDVFIGPNATFVNDRYPRSKHRPAEFEKTILGKGCSIGANATLLPGINIGKYAMVGAGSVVTKSVMDYQLVVGNPARFIGWVNERGERLIEDGNILVDSEGTMYQLVSGKLIKTK